MKKVIIVGAGAQGNVISGVLAKAPVVSPPVVVCLAGACFATARTTRLSRVADIEIS